MMDPTKTGTVIRAGSHWVWQASGVRTQIRVVGRGPETQLEKIRSILCGSPRRVAYLRQIHSSKAVQACEGLCGAADALFTDRTDLAMAVATADCLPIVLSGLHQSALIHAGWRGLESEIVRRALSRLTGPTERVAAWIGPGIGTCCYEVGPDVAERVARSSSSGVVVHTDSGAIHLDLLKAARDQLEAEGVQEIESLPLCTYCEPRRLWSYRREGPGAGRNWTLAWRETPTER
jgi:YfiH family protein